MRAVAYIRVSSADQVEGRSLDAQERLFREWCANHGWEPGTVYREEGRSAHIDSISRRPVFRQLLDHAEKQQFQAVVVHSFDRWARNAKVALDSLALLGRIVSALVLPEAWMDRVLAQVHLANEVNRLELERKETGQRLKRLGQVYMDGLRTPQEYQREKRLLEDKLGSLVIPGADAARDAGMLLENLPSL